MAHTAAAVNNARKSPEQEKPRESTDFVIEQFEVLDTSTTDVFRGTISKVGIVVMIANYFKVDGT